MLQTSTGASDDIRRCSSLAYQTVSEYGLCSAVGPLSVNALSNGGSDEPPLIGRDSGELHSSQLPEELVASVDLGSSHILGASMASQSEGQWRAVLERLKDSTFLHPKETMPHPMNWHACHGEVGLAATLAGVATSARPSDLINLGGS